MSKTEQILEEMQAALLAGLPVDVVLKEAYAKIPEPAFNEHRALQFVEPENRLDASKALRAARGTDAAKRAIGKGAKGSSVASRKGRELSD